MEKPLSEIPAIGIQWHGQLDDYNTVVFQAACPIDGDFDATLDKLRIAAARQFAIRHLPSERKTLEDFRTGLRSAQEALFSAESEKDVMHESWSKEWSTSGRRGEFKLAPAQRQQVERNEAERAKARQSIDAAEKAIAGQELLIAQYEAQAGA